MDFKKLFRLAYEYSLFLKGADGLFELFSGMFLLFFPLSSILGLLNAVFSHELVEDPKDLLANALIHAFSSMPQGVDYFWAAFLILHGIIKLGLVAGLLERKVWVYPLAVWILIAFLIYQIYLVVLIYSVFYILLTIIDFIVISFIIWDYKKLVKGKI